MFILLFILFIGIPLLKEEMERSAALSLTLTAEVGEGANWLDAK